MKTISFNIESIDIGEETRLYNDVYRYAYNRFRSRLKEIDVRAKCNEIWKGQLNSWLLQCAIKDAGALNARLGDKKVVFGGKHNLKQFLKGLISKAEYKENKQIPICSQGEMLHNGNRMFEFRFAEGSITFKISKMKHIEITLPTFHKNLNGELLALQSLIDQKKATVSVKISRDRIWLTYDESLLSETTGFRYWIAFKMRFLAKYVNKLNGKFMLLHSCLYFWYFIAAINRLIKEKDTICYGALNYMAILNQRQGEKLNKLWDTIRE